MTSFNELKNEVFENLSKYPKIEAFFQDSLKERMKIDEGWIENALVQCILKGTLYESDPICAWVNCISDDQVNSKVLKDKLRPTDQYDEQMCDVLAELHGYHNLRQSGFQELTALKKDKGKSPDFRAERNGEHYLFEVKNMRSSFDIQNILFDKCGAERLRSPAKYSGLVIYFVASSNWRNIRLLDRENEKLLRNLENWLGKTFAAIQSSGESPPRSLRAFEAKSKEGRLVIHCQLDVSQAPATFFYFDDRDFEATNPLTRHYFLNGFMRKVTRIADVGVQQLLEFDEHNAHVKCVLIHWERTGEFKNHFERECLAIVTSIDNLAKNISADLFVRLLDHDPLP